MLSPPPSYDLVLCLPKGCPRREEAKEKCTCASGPICVECHLVLSSHTGLHASLGPPSSLGPLIAYCAQVQALEPLSSHQGLTRGLLPGVGLAGAVETGAGRERGLIWLSRRRAQVSVSFTDEAPPLYDEDLGPLRPRPRRNRVDEPVKEEPAQPTGVYKPRGRPPAARKWKVGLGFPQAVFQCRALNS